MSSTNKPAVLKRQPSAKPKQQQAAKPVPECGQSWHVSFWQICRCGHGSYVEQDARATALFQPFLPWWQVIRGRCEPRQSHRFRQIQHLPSDESQTTYISLSICTGPHNGCLRASNAIVGDADHWSKCFAFLPISDHFGQKKLLPLFQITSHFKNFGEL